MSVEAPVPVEETPVIANPETTEVKKMPETTQTAAEPTVAQDTVNGQVQNADEGVVGGTPASEGVLGYKEPGLLKMLKGYQKHHFWFGNEAVKPEALTGYLQSAKPELAHHNASWAQETGKGVLFYSKREEDKATPAGMIMLSDVSKITKEGETEFQFKDGHHQQKFQAKDTAERDAWLLALEKESEKAKTMKEGVIGSEGYKKNLAGHATPVLATAGGAMVAGRATEHNKALDANTATAGTTNGVNHNAVVQEEKKEVAKQDKTSRSRSRGNRKSFFGGLLDKKDKTEDNKDLKKEEKKEEKIEKKEEKMEQKEEKKEIKAEKKEEKLEKKEEKKEIKEEKKEEAAHKKEETKATHDSSKAKEAVEAASVAAVPAAAIGAEKKHDDKAISTEKKGKRTSVFGGIFGKKNVTSPDVEKSETEAGPAVPVKDSNIPPVSETAPKIEQPVHQAPLDTAAVVAPVDTVQTPAAVEDPVAMDKSVAPMETTSTPKQQKESGGILGFIKKAESKLAGNKEAKSEAKEEKAAEEVARTPAAATAVEPTTESPAAINGEERPVNPQRRSSLMERFGTKRANKTSETDGTPTEVKREKSPLPSKVAGLFRKPSKAVKPTEEKHVGTNGLTNGHSEPATIAERTETVPASANVGEANPQNLEATTIHDQVTAAPEVQTSA